MPNPTPPSPESEHEHDLRMFCYRALGLLYTVQDEAHIQLDPTTFEWLPTRCSNLPPNFASLRAKLSEELRRLTG